MSGHWAQIAAQATNMTFNSNFKQDASRLHFLESQRFAKIKVALGVLVGFGRHGGRLGVWKRLLGL